MEAAHVELYFIERSEFCQSSGTKGAIPFTPRGFILLDADQVVATVSSHKIHTPYQTFGRISFAHSKHGKRDVDKYVDRFKMVKKRAISQQDFVDAFDLNMQAQTPISEFKQHAGLKRQVVHLVKKALSAAAGILS